MKKFFEEYGSVAIIVIVINDDTGFSCYALDGEWHILNEGK